VVAAAVLALQLAMPLTDGMVWFGWPYDYFLAMAHAIQAETPYPFYWTPGWAYVLGTLTPLVAAGGAFAVGAGYFALRAGARVAAVPLAVGVCAIVVYAVGATINSISSWHGVPL
jgi:hypothetical protein